MIDIFALQQNIKQNKIENCYVLCGSDEQLIKEGVSSIVNKVIDKNFMELNYIKFDGNSVESFDTIVNACQTLPFMSEKKVVLIYRAAFIQDEKSGNGKLSSDSAFNEILNYVDKIPEHCVLIIYDVFKSKRDKPGKRINKLDKKVSVVKADKMKGLQLENKVKNFFEIRNKDIGKIELKIFCDLMEENNLSSIENEVEKLCCYVYDRDITREDIKSLFLKSSDDDIFDLVNPISHKKVKEALEVMNELIYRGEKIPYILNMIERQFNLLFRVKLGIQCGKNKQEIIKELGKFNVRSEYAVDMLIKQSKKFTLRQIQHALELCINTEQKMKSSSLNEKTELELLIINAIAG